MAYLLSWVLWLAYTLAVTAAMYAFLSFAETMVSRLLGCSCYYLYDYEGILTKGGHLRYTPRTTPVVLKQPKLAQAPVVMDKYEEYRKKVRRVLDSKWSFLPGHLLDAAMDEPREAVLSRQPTAEGWAGRVLDAASGWLAADTGLPSDLVRQVLDVKDIDDQVRLADSEIVLMDMAETFQRVKDLTDVATAAAVFRTLRMKGRPLMKAPDYIKTAAAYEALETTDPALLRMFSPGGLSDEQWLSLRYRARDF